jgi:hypothetical protein
MKPTKYTGIDNMEKETYLNGKLVIYKNFFKDWNSLKALEAGKRKFIYNLEIEEIYKISSFPTKKSLEGNVERCSLIVEQPTFFNVEKPDYTYSNGKEILKRMKLIRGTELNLLFKHLKYTFYKDAGANSLQLNSYLKNGKIMKGMGIHKDIFPHFSIKYPIIIFNFSAKFFNFSEIEKNRRENWLHEEIVVPENSLTIMNSEFSHGVKDNTNITTSLLAEGKSIVVRNFVVKNPKKRKKESDGEKQLKNKKTKFL